MFSLRHNVCVNTKLPEPNGLIGLVSSSHLHPGGGGGGGGGGRSVRFFADRSPPPQCLDSGSAIDGFLDPDPDPCFECGSQSGFITRFIGWSGSMNALFILLKVNIISPETA